MVYVILALWEHGSLKTDRSCARKDYLHRVLHEVIKEAAAIAGSEGFKWGAISGAMIGGMKETFALKELTRNGLSMNEVAKIQKESGFPKDVISQLHSMDEYRVYKEAGLKPIMINGRTALIQNVDKDFVSTLSDGTKVTNHMRMKRGLAPLDKVHSKTNIKILIRDL